MRVLGEMGQFLNWASPRKSLFRYSGEDPWVTRAQKSETSRSPGQFNRMSCLLPGSWESIVFCWHLLWNSIKDSPRNTALVVECLYTIWKKDGATPIKSWFNMAPLQIASFWEPRSIYFHYGVVVDFTPFPPKKSPSQNRKSFPKFWGEYKNMFCFLKPPSQPTKITTLQVGSMLLTSWALDSLHYTKKNASTLGGGIPLLNYQTLR